MVLFDNMQGQYEEDIHAWINMFFIYIFFNFSVLLKYIQFLLIVIIVSFTWKYLGHANK